MAKQEWLQLGHRKKWQNKPLVLEKPDARSPFVALGIDLMVRMKEWLRYAIQRDLCLCTPRADDRVNYVAQLKLVSGACASFRLPASARMPVGVWWPMWPLSGSWIDVIPYCRVLTPPTPYSHSTHLHCTSYFSPLTQHLRLSYVPGARGKQRRGSSVYGNDGPIDFRANDCRSPARRVKRRLWLLVFAAGQV